MRKSQSALEYLLVYGWVFVIIVIVGAALFYLGVFNPDADNKFLTEESFELDEVGVYDHTLNDNGDWQITLYPRGWDVRIQDIIIGNETFNFNNEFVANSRLETFSGNLDDIYEFGDDYLYDMYITYHRPDSGLDHLAVGVFAGVVQGTFNFSTLTITQDLQGSFFQTTQGDFNQGIESQTNVNLIPGSIVLGYKNGWYNTNYNYRTQITITEESYNALTNYPVMFELDTETLILNNKLKSDGSDLRIVIDGTSVPYQIENNTLNTQNTKIWLLINLTSNENKTLYAYYGNPGAGAPSFNTDLIYLTGSEGHFENDKIYASIGNDNNPSNWGFDTIYEKTTGRDISNYYTFLFNRDNNNPHSVTATDAGPIYVELNMSGTGNEKNNGDLVYRMFSRNNIIRWMNNDSITPNSNFFIGSDNSELDSFEANGVIQTLTTYSYNNIEHSYVRLFNQTSNYSLVLISPVSLTQADVSGDNANNIDEFIGLSNNTDVIISYFDYYIGVIDQNNCETLSDISINQPSYNIGSEEGLYVLTGIFTSNSHDTSSATTNYSRIEFSGYETPGTNIRVRIRSGITQSACESSAWHGPTGINDYYEFDQNINPIHDNNRWVQYRVYLNSDNDFYSPRFDEINISYS